MKKVAAGVNALSKFKKPNEIEEEKMPK